MSVAASDRSFIQLPDTQPLTGELHDTGRGESPSMWDCEESLLDVLFMYISADFYLRMKDVENDVMTPPSGRETL